MLLSITDLGHVIARRTLSIPDKGPVHVRIGQPFVPDDYGGNYCCPYQVEGIGDGKIRYGSGIDSLQALYMALISLSTDLYTSPEQQLAGIFWEESRDLGLPVAEAVKDLVPRAGEEKSGDG